MAFIRVGVGGAVGEVTAQDAKSQAVFEDYLIARGGPVEGTTKQKLDWIAADLRRYIVDTVQDYRRIQAENTAKRTQAPVDFS